MESIMNRAEQRMSELELTPAEFARRMEELPQTINNWRKRGKIPGDKIFKAAGVLNCDAHWLQEGKNAAIDTSSPINKSAMSDAVTLVLFIQEKTGKEFSVNEWTELLTHFYTKYETELKTGTKTDKSELLLDFHTLMDELKSTKKPPFPEIETS